MTPNDELRKYIQELIAQELSEMTTTGNVAGYLTPLAFSGNRTKNLARKKRIATQLGMKLTRRGKEQLSRPADKLVEGRSPYYDFRDEQGTPQKKIAQKISEIHKSLDMVERLLKMSSRYQMESGVANEELYRRTQEGLRKMENKLLMLTKKIRELRGN